MGTNDLSLAVAGAPAGIKKAAPGKAIQSPPVPPGVEATAEEVEAYDYICAVLRAAGMEHMTAGMAIYMVAQTWVDLGEARTKCKVRGRTQVSEKGWEADTPWALDERRLKQELKDWLRQVCCTIPSQARVQKELGGSSPQDDLFGDLVGHANGLPGPSSTH